MKEIDVTRVETEELREKFPNLYQEQIKRGITATITLFSERAHAQLFERSSGLQLAYGSKALFNRYLSAKKAAATSDFGCPNCLHQSIECKRGEWFAPRLFVVDGKPSCLSYVYFD